LGVLLSGGVGMPRGWMFFLPNLTVLLLFAQLVCSGVLRSGLFKKGLEAGFAVLAGFAKIREKIANLYSGAPFCWGQPVWHLGLE